MIEKDEEHFSGKVSQKAIIRKGDRILISRDVNDGSVWELPGGRMNTNEDPLDGLKREIFEELGVEITVGTIIYSAQEHHMRDDSTMLMLAYEASLMDDSQEFVLATDEVAEVKWITEDEVKNFEFFEDMTRVLKKYFSK